MYSRGLREHVTHVRQTLEIFEKTSVVCKGLKMYILSTQGRILGSCS